MREIKFRAFDRSNKIMRFADIYDFDELSEWEVWERQSSLAVNDSSKFDVMQFTGLQDKNGVDIYEYMEIDGLYNVEFRGGSYILIDISRGDILLLCNYINGLGGNVKITREYTKI